MASEAVNGKEMIHEISALSRRTVKMKICGLTVGGIGLLAAIVGIGVFLSSFLIGPSATGFKIDIPDALIPLQDGGHEAFGSIADAVGEGIAGISSKIFGLSVAVALIYTPFKVFREGFNPSSLVPLFSIIIFGTTFKLLPAMLGVGEGVGQGLSSTISATSKVTKFVENDETGKLLEYLKSANSGSSDKIPLINYVVAQVSIKDGETDIDLVKSVVDTYKAGTSVTEIPDNIRYALEMAAFGKAVTPAAVSYEDNKNDLARNYSGLGKSSFFTGGILTLIGFLILVWVRRLNQRVQFLNNYAIR
ncbi:hypothetical protein OJ405_002749 [Salmonella enterica]|nr:hypothetical protein [Salmonella enterica]ELS1746406.1 hypothetical protein [Salmonella enterica]ELW3720569.1 hypothetical protein [Salmonella enterica]EMB7326596.1 hypothetical protein [Salmonella enterica]